MLTTTHVTMSGALSRLSRSGRSGPLANRVERLLPDDDTRRAVLWGGLAPDVGLTVLTIGAAGWYPLTQGLSLQETFRHVYDDMFFRDPVWMAAHNVLHAPLVLLVLLVLGVRLRASEGTGRGRLGRWLVAFAVGALLHSAVDVVTHHDDGPLLLFPLDWSYRFTSPVSYWDPAHGGRWLGPIDQAITVLGGGWLLVTWARRRLAGSSDQN